MAHKEHHGFLYGVGAAVCSAAIAVFTKLAAAVPTETLIFARFSICLPLILWIAFKKNVKISFGKLPGHLLRSLAGLASMYCYFYAIKKLPLVNAITLANTTPLFMPFVVLVWLRVLVSKMRFLALGVGFLGVLLLLRPANLDLGEGNWIGLGSGLLSAIALMGVRQLSKTESTETILTYYFLICTVLSFFPVAVTWEGVPHYADRLYILGMGVFSYLYQLAITKSYTHGPATKMSVLNYLAVAFGGLTGWWVFGEVPDVWVWIGTLLIVASAFGALFDKTPPRRLGSS